MHGRRVRGAVMQAAHDVWSVNTDFEYHEEQKIETAGRVGVAREKARAST
jgi:hypothetical protein